jgi:cytoskeleton protein RodZ
MATGIGDALVAARRQQGVALADAAAETRVREAYLAALEAEDFAALGGDVYVKGFLRSYARFLRLDPEPLIAAYRHHYERHHQQEISSLAQQPVAPLPAERSPALVVGIGVALIALVVLGVIGVLSGRNEEPETPAAAPEEVPAQSDVATAPTTPVTEPTGPGALGDEPTEFLDAQKVRMVIAVQGGESWLKVSVDGVTELEGLQPDGSELTYEGDETISVRIGEPAVVSLKVNGRRVDDVGRPGKAITKTFTVEGA